jgi:uncharacterized protein
MSVDHIRYDLLAQEALRGVVRRVLADTAKNGLAGEHHFYISFDTRAAGVRLSQRLRDQYPEEMTIVLQHQFWDLGVTDHAFEVGLSFNGVPERLLVPFDAIKGFFDPSVQFGLQFEIDPGAQREKTLAVSAPVVVDAKAATSSRAVPGEPTATPVAPALARGAAEQSPAGIAETIPARSNPKGPSAGGEVVRLDRFRKK